MPVDVDMDVGVAFQVSSLLSPHVQDSRAPPVLGAEELGLVFIAHAGGGEGRCHLNPNPPRFL